MNEVENGLQDSASGLITKQKAASNKNSHFQPTSYESSEVLKNGKKQSARRRKGFSKPRRINPVVSKSKSDDFKISSLDSVLKRVLKAKESEELKLLKQNNQENNPKMIDVHETLAMHPHMPKTTNTPPGSVESENSIYSNERPEENLADQSNNSEPYVKVRPQSSGDISPDLSLSHEELQRSFSSDTAMRKASVSPTERFSKESRDLAEVGRPSPPAFSTNSLPSMNMNNHGALVAMAASMGIPTMMPSNGMIPSSLPSLIAMQHYKRRDSIHEEEKKSYNVAAKERVENFSPSNRNLPSLPNGVPFHPNSNETSPPTADVRAQYKRPPHTYPALIASAILDSPGNLITLRGIYDYIMNNFPYYKYCHDKSAWQNSIRHNLSLNQCFVKVPRYENAAKSNYWTMTREGFEEFGNENSFKRRRRRGASLAPISAYKGKKGQHEGAKNAAKNKPELRVAATGNGSIPHSAPGLMTDERFNVGAFPPHFMSLAASGVWSPGLRRDDGSAKSRKRSLSPSENDVSKHPRMVVLKQGDGPSLDGIKNDDPNRPNSLSSVEEMQGALNYFSKSLLDSKALGKTADKLDQQALPSAAQQWTAAQQKNFVPTSRGAMPLPLATSERGSVSPNKGALDHQLKETVQLDGVEIGKVVFHGQDASEMSVRQYHCKLCSYTYLGASEFVLEQHFRAAHQFELNNLKAKAVSGVHDKLPESPKRSELPMTLPSMLPGLPSRSMLVAAQSNAQNLLAAAQASAIGNSAPGFPYSASFSSALLNDSVMRSIAKQANQGKVVGSEMDAGLEAYVQRQALNNALQQAAAASTSQEQLRLLYQQLAMNNALLANPAGVFPARPTSDLDQSSSLSQQIWQQYQQKLYSQMKEALTDKSGENNSSQIRRNSIPDGALTENHTDSVMSPQRSPLSNPDVETELKKSIHTWKQCGQCDFTAKGEHGLELHYRKAHSGADATSSAAEDLTNESTAENDQLQMPITKIDFYAKTLNKAREEVNGRKVTSPVLPTPPLSNSPSNPKRNFVPLDLSGVKEEQDEATVDKPGNYSSAATQTMEQGGDDVSGNRSCPHCSISFGDDMMHALHMSCHDKVDPFKCTICGQCCNEKYYFNVHLLRGLHRAARSPISRETSVEATRSDGEFSPRRHSNSGSDVSSVASRSRTNSDVNDAVY